MKISTLVMLVSVVAATAAGAYLFHATRQVDTTVDGRHAEPAPAPTVMRPVFSLNDIDGNQRSITEWDGKALVVNFWATWCAPCRREIPVLIEMQEELAARDIQFIGIAIDEIEAVRQYAVEMPFNYPILVGEQEGIDAAEAFGADVVALPMTVFTDHAGRVIDVHAGEIARSELESILSRLPQ
jgi:thiol-disulfide isomerase/thioredoxin